MKRVLLAAVLGCTVWGSAVPEVVVAGHRFGGGLHYLRTVGEIKDAPDWSADSFGLIGSYQFSPPLVKFEFDVEWVPNYGGTDHSMVEPQAWVLVGGLIYGSGGIGIGYIDGGWQDNPFYALRAGANLRLGTLNLDVFATYRFQSAQVFDDFDSKDLDSVTLGAIVRFGK